VKYLLSEITHSVKIIIQTVVTFLSTETLRVH
jgi:hypothetical protein